MLNMEWIWRPNYSVGAISLGDKIEKYLDVFGLICLDEVVDNTGWIRYKLPNIDTYIDSEDGIIVSISSYDIFIYKDNNLIGLDVHDLNKILGCDPDDIGYPVLYEDGDIQTPYDYNILGLQLWVSDGKVVLASCVKAV
jgi:hypothetical protein